MVMNQELAQDGVDERPENPLLSVAAYIKQNYSLTLRFSAEQSGWSFDQRFEITLEDARRGYHGNFDVERYELNFAAGESMTVKLVQADWHGFLFGDWRGMHAALSSTELCGVPQVK